MLLNEIDDQSLALVIGYDLTMDKRLPDRPLTAREVSSLGVSWRYESAFCNGHEDALAGNDYRYDIAREKLGLVIGF